MAKHAHKNIGDHHPHQLKTEMSHPLLINVTCFSTETPHQEMIYTLSKTVSNRAYIFSCTCAVTQIVKECLSRLLQDLDVQLQHQLNGRLTCAHSTDTETQHNQFKNEGTEVWIMARMQLRCGCWARPTLPFLLLQYPWHSSRAHSHGQVQVIYTGNQLIPAARSKAVKKK